MNATARCGLARWLPLRLAALLLLLAAVSLFYWPSPRALHELWRDSERATYAHGYLILAISVALLWRNRVAFNAAPLRPLAWGIAPLLLLSGAWLFAYYAGFQLVHLLLMPLLFGAAVLTVFGGAALRRCAFPFGYLYLAMSVWDYLNPAAQWGTVYAVRSTLRAVGVPAFFEGNRVQLPSGTFEVADGCSGLHFAIVGVAIALLLGELRRDGWRMRVGLVGIVLALAVVSNWIRVLVIILAGHFTQMQHYLVTGSHYEFGWAVFAAALVVFYLIERRIGLTPTRPASNADAGRAMRGPLLRRLLPVAAAAMAVMLLPTLVDTAVSRAAADPPGSALPTARPAWQGPMADLDADWRPAFAGADLEEHLSYARSASPQSPRIELYSAWFATQKQGKELGGYNNLLGGRLALSDVGVLRAAGRDFRTAVLADAAGRQSILWYAYGVGGRWFTNARRAQMRYSLDVLSGMQAPASQVLAARARCIPNCETAAANLRSFFEGPDRSSPPPQVAYR